MKKFIILDWANNHVFKTKVFSDAEDALEFIDGNVEEDEIDEYFVSSTEDYTPTRLNSLDLLEERDYNAQL